MTTLPDVSASPFAVAAIANSPFGLEVELDPKMALSPADKETLRELYRHDGLLLVHGGALSADEQADFCRRFGPVPLDQHDVYLVSNTQENGILADLELLFHHDIPYVPAPFLAGCLHAVEVSQGVSTTRFANGFAAYERLPEGLRERIAEMKAVFTRPRVEDRRCRLTDAWSGDNCAIHPLVGHQEKTGRPYLFANAHSTALVCGLTEADSDALLQELGSYLYTADNVYEHHWTNGDTILWDNLAHQHARARVTHGVRTLRRVSVAVLAYDQQYPADAAWFVDLQEGRINAEDLQAA